jgi:flagellar basal body-associated protein FliL
MGQLDDREAEHHPRKNVIMKALGIKEELKPEVFMSPVQPAKGDMFLICSDGLSGMVDDDGIEAILSSDQSVEQKVLDLVTNANVPGKGLDNITAQVIKVVESPYPLSNHPDHNPNWRNDSNSNPTLDLTKESDPQPVTPPKKKKVKLLLAILIPAIALMLLIGGGVAAYFIWWHGKEKIEEPIQTQQVTSEDEEQQKDENNTVEGKNQQNENNKVEESQQDGQCGVETENADQEKKTGKEVKKEDGKKTEKETKSKPKSKGFNFGKR